MLRFFFAAAAMLTALGALYFLHVRLTGKDLPFYRKLVQESADLRSHCAIERSPVRGLRERVRKDIWTIQERRRDHSRLKSQKSDMTLTQQGGKMEAVEILREIEGWTSSDGETRHIAAESGVCYFPACLGTAHHLSADFEQSKCFAQKADFAKESIDLIGSFYIEHPMGRLYGEKGTFPRDGKPKEIHFEEGVLFEAAKAPFSISSLRAFTQGPFNQPLSSQEIHFLDGVEIHTASNIRASGNSALIHDGTLRLFSEDASLCTLYRGQDRIDAQEFQFDKTTGELLCLSPHGNIEKNQTHFEADTGRALFSEHSEPQILFLEGGVRIASHLQGKESFAVADSAIFYLNAKKVVLESIPIHRVFFWQEGLEVSAPTVHIQKAIQAFGDVRFFFFPEEKTTLNNLFCP